MFDKLFDLPAHPLLIHAPIVLLPIAAIATVVLAAKPAWRARASWWMVGALFVIVVLLFGAKQSGEALIEAYDRANGAGAVDISKHQDLAETTFLMTLAWFAVFGLLTVLERVERVRVGFLEAVASNMTARQAIAVVAAVLGFLATVWLIRTGHEGSRSVWGPRVDILFPEG
jgi:uncharacterized membrane protein